MTRRYVGCKLPHTTVVDYGLSLQQCAEVGGDAIYEEGSSTAPSHGRTSYPTDAGGSPIPIDWQKKKPRGN